ncbi:MAG: DUF2934 domain-containing protein [Methylobacillus sp.]|jgi:hypothetical protein|nr:DUF2934 domain-containing protein [Methylobacillus sp.]
MAEVKKTAAAKKPATKKTTAKTAVKKPVTAKKPATKTATKTVAKKPATKSAPAKKSAATWNPGNEERYNMIQVAAYYLAERDQFRRSPLEYWTKAEAQIRAMLPK